MQQIYAANLKSHRNVISVKLQITLLHECSPVNLLHIFRTLFSKNASGCLFLHISKLPSFAPSPVTYGVVSLVKLTKLMLLNMEIRSYMKKLNKRGSTKDLVEILKEFLSNSYEESLHLIFSVNLINNCASTT